jgi:hypothetical protein
MDPAQVVAGHPLAHSDDPRRVFQQTMWSSALPKGPTRRQAKALNWEQRWVHQERIKLFALALAGEQPEGVTAAQRKRPQGEHAARQAMDAVAPGDALVPPERERVYQEHPARFVMRLQPFAAQHKRFGKLVLDLQPGERQRFTVLYTHPEGDRLAKKDPPFAQLPMIDQPAQTEPIPEFGNGPQSQGQQPGHKDERLIQQSKPDPVPGTAGTEPLFREPGALIKARCHDLRLPFLPGQRSFLLLI